MFQALFAKAHHKIGQATRMMLAMSVVAALLAGAAAVALGHIGSLVRDAWAERYHSYLLADELRQSSDDLTRLARTYVLTADPAYEEQYMAILAIRDGKQERPANYNRIYWDFVAAGRPASAGSGLQKPLHELMQDAGFTEEEFALLSKAQANSDGLVNLEVRAMNAVKGLFADAAGNYTVKGNPDMALAAKLLHSPEYHGFKADIMEPVDQFLAKMESRFDSRIAGLELLATIAKIVLYVLVVLLAAAMTYLTRGISKLVLTPIANLTETMQRVEHGERLTVVPHIENDDEFGMMARQISVALAANQANMKMVAEVSELVHATTNGIFSHRLALDSDKQELRDIANGLNKMMDSLEKAFEIIVRAMSAFAAGDLSQSLDRNVLPGKYSEVLANAEQARANLSSIIHQTRQTTRSLSDRIHTLASAIQKLQTRTEGSAAAIEQTAASLAGLTDSAGRASDRALKADGIVEKARQTADRGLTIMNDVTKAMAGISQSSSEVNQIVDLIDSIAFQTNLLALNARVEAARAGEAGRGFAVVASEVSALSMRATEATASIGQLIRNSGEQVASGSKLIDIAASTIEEIGQSVANISALAADIATAMREQSTGLSEISHAVSELDNTTQQNAAMVASTTSDTEALTQWAEELSLSVDKFNLGQIPSLEYRRSTAA